MVSYLHVPNLLRSPYMQGEFYADGTSCRVARRSSSIRSPHYLLVVEAINNLKYLLMCRPVVPSDVVHDAINHCSSPCSHFLGLTRPRLRTALAGLTHVARSPRDSVETLRMITPSSLLTPAPTAPARSSPCPTRPCAAPPPTANSPAQHAHLGRPFHGTVTWKWVTFWQSSAPF
jgi:hypothetical protein